MIGNYRKNRVGYCRRGLLLSFFKISTALERRGVLTRISVFCLDEPKLRRFTKFVVRNKNFKPKAHLSSNKKKLCMKAQKPL